MSRVGVEGRRAFLGRTGLAMAGGACCGVACGDALQDLQAWRGLDAQVRRQCEGFLRTYPGAIARFFPGENGCILADLTQGEREVLVEDFAKNESHEERLAKPDLLDMVSDPYPAGLEVEAWPENLDPGRYRNDAFFKAVYGNSEDEVRANLETVLFCGHSVPFNRRNGAAEALRRAGARIEALVSAKARLRPYVAKLGGGFAWRVVAGTNRLSGHSFGMALDLNPGLGGYWRWERGADLSAMARRREYPVELVEALEAEKFIWGGKWYHFDLMHFEFRPEFFA